MAVRYLSQDKLERARKSTGASASEEQILEAYKKLGGAFIEEGLEEEVETEKPKKTKKSK